MLDRLRQMSRLTSGEALSGIPEAEADRLIELLLRIKGNMTALDAAETDAQGKERRG